MEQKRKEVLNRVNHIVDNFCELCEMKKKFGRNVTKLQRYCLHECSHGEVLQSLGERLIEMSNHKANMILNKGRMMSTQEVRYLLNRGFHKDEISEVLKLSKKEKRKYFDNVLVGVEVANYKEEEKAGVT